jgi:hypothetical protein
MRVQADSKNYQDLLLASQGRIALNQLKISDFRINKIDSHLGEETSQNTLHVVNNAILRLIQSIEMVNKNLSAGELSNQSSNLERTITVLIESVNGLLTIKNKADNDNSMATGRNSDAIQSSLQRLQEIIITILNPSGILSKRASLDLSLLGIKLMQDGLLGIDHKVIKEAVLSNSQEVTSTVKAFSTSLLETMSFCIDPNSGNLLCIGRKLEEKGDGGTSKVFEALNEKLEKERAELMKTLNLAELLISQSRQFIENLKFSSGMLINEE